MSPAPAPASGEGRSALLAGIFCYAIWGVGPLIFQQMGAVGADAWEIMGHRAVWSVLWAGLLVLMAKQASQVWSVLRDPKTVGLLLVSTLLIAGNWTLFVWSVNNGKTLETSLGYYLNPLINMAAGALLFRERIDRFGKAAIALAAIGVGVQAWALGHAPIISLTLALSFGAYGIIRKSIRADAQTGLFVECLFITLPGLAYLWFIHAQGGGHFFDSPQAAFWLFMAGPFTVAPLVLFSWAARRMPLSTMGFLQFLAPTMSFVIGVSQGEDFGVLRGVSFAFIWIGAAVFAYGAWRRLKQARQEALAADEVTACEPESVVAPMDPIGQDALDEPIAEEEAVRASRA